MLYEAVSIFFKWYLLALWISETWTKTSMSKVYGWNIVLTNDPLYVTDFSQGCSYLPYVYCQCSFDVLRHVLIKLSGLTPWQTIKLCVLFISIKGITHQKDFITSIEALNHLYFFHLHGNENLEITKYSLWMWMPHKYS